jgi:hypothetical protein
MKKHFSAAVPLTVVLFVATFCLGVAAQAANAAPRSDGNAAAAFDKLKTLAGTWEATTQKGKVTTTYEVVSNGSAILERLQVPGETEMVTVYNLDGNKLVLTHYCSAGNQPRMETSGLSPDGQLVFNFAGGDNLSDPTTGHMHHAVLKFASADDFTYDWTFQQDGKPRFTENIHYIRVK